MTKILIDEAALAEQSAPPECKTEAEKTAYAFGWYKALESVRKPWVGLTDEERRACTQSPFTADNYLAIEAKLKEKNT